MFRRLKEGERNEDELVSSDAKESRELNERRTDLRLQKHRPAGLI